MDKDSSLHCWLGLRALPREVLLLGRLLLMMEAPRDEKGSFVSLATDSGDPPGSVLRRGLCQMRVSG